VWEGGLLFTSESDRGLSEARKAVYCGLGSCDSHPRSRFADVYAAV